jgi:glycosyltransferase involved in cell wall biosynthesis
LIEFHFRPHLSADRTKTVPYFLVSNRLVENKNTETVIEAFARYREVSKNKLWDLVILGSGPLESKIRDQITRLALDDCVRLEGFLKYHDLPRLYHGAGALILASTWEPWGLVVNEALAAGLPVIVSTKVGSVCELVRHGENGFVFEPLDVQSLQRHMLDLADDNLMCMKFGERSLEIIKDWDPDRFGLGLQGATRMAFENPKKKVFLDKFVVHLLARWQKFLSPGRLLARRALKQNRQS